MTIVIYAIVAPVLVALVYLNE